MPEIQENDVTAGRLQWGRLVSAAMVTIALLLGIAAASTGGTDLAAEAKALADDTPTVANRMRLASAAVAQGRHAEAEQLYRDAAEGVHADDPSLKLGRGKALIELGRFSDAIVVLEDLAKQGDEGNTPQAVLARARAYHGQKRLAEAETNYAWASERMPGFEAIARYTAFLAEAGRMKEARDNLGEIDRRIERLSGPFRKEAQGWRDLAAARVR